MAEAKTIMVVDDSMLARMMLKKFTSIACPDAKIIEAKDGNDALEKVQGAAIDAALIDFNMPGINGLELSKRLKNQFPQIRMALVTANIQDYIADEAKTLGVSFISKPIDQEKISSFFAPLGK